MRTRIARAADRRTGTRRSILLLAVTKIFPAEAIQDAYALGLREFGENYVQEFEGKAPSVSGLAGARYHLIGHLQSNKAAKAAELFQVVQTVDSAKLARRLNEAGRPLDVMLEVKLSDEDAKSGVDPEGVPALIEAVRQYPNLRLRGTNDDAALERRSGGASGMFSKAARAGGGTRAERAFDGHVERPRNRHRRGLHLRPRGHGIIRQAEEDVMPARSWATDKHR